MRDDRDSMIWELEKGTMTMFAAEIVGTDFFIFIICMASIGTIGPAPPPPMQVAFTLGLTINLIIMMFGHVSGAHPAITIGAVIVGLKTIPTAVVYILGQFIDATIEYGLLKVPFSYVIAISTTNHNAGGAVQPKLDPNPNPNSTAGLCVVVVHPEVNSIQAALIEMFCTSCILCAACAAWDPRCAHTTGSIALRFGLSVTVIFFATSSYTECDMNPARTFGPAFWNNAWKDQ